MRSRSPYSILFRCSGIAAVLAFAFCLAALRVPVNAAAAASSKPLMKQISRFSASTVPAMAPEET